jgi:hypothetical protein
VEPRFEILKCTYNGMKFSVLDDTTYISNNPLLDSIVVLGIDQYCCDPVSSDPVWNPPCTVDCQAQALPCITQPTIPAVSACAECPRPVG